MRGILFTILPLLAVACGPSSEGPSTDANETDELSVEASPATQAEIGVTRWSLKRYDATAGVRGYDAADALVMEFRRIATNTAEQYVLRYGDETARLVFAIDPAGKAVPVESNFVGKYLRVTELIVLDLEASGTTPIPGQAGDLSAQTLHPLSPSDPYLCDQECMKKRYPHLVYENDCAALKPYCEKETKRVAAAAAGVPTWCPYPGVYKTEYLEECGGVWKMDCIDAKMSECNSKRTDAAQGVDGWCDLSDPKSPLSACLVKP